MNIATIADIHFANHRRFGGRVERGLNARARSILNALAAAVDETIEARCSMLVVAGDLFDTARPEPQLEAAAGEELARLGPLGIRVLLLAGNHDQVSTAPGDHALGPLGLLEHVTVVDAPRVFLDAPGWEVWAVPSKPGADEPWLRGVLEGMLAAQREQAEHSFVPPRRRRLLALHFGIYDASTPAFMRGIPGSIDVDALRAFVREYDFDVCVSGDWHARKTWRVEGGATIVQVGALVPTGFDNPGLDGYGSVVVARTQGLAPGQRAAVDVVELAGPRFVKAATRADATKLLEQAREDGHELFISYAAAPESMVEDAAWLAQRTGEGKGALAEVVADTAVARAEARTAANAARSAATLDEAIDVFVGAMPLPDEAKRTRVLERVRGYLR